MNSLISIMLHCFRQINSSLLKIAGWGVIFSMAVIAIVIPYEILQRYLVGNMPPWSGEISTYALVWASMLGAAIALKKGYQVGITYAYEHLPARAGRALQILASIVMLVFLSVMCLYGIEQTEINFNQKSPAMELPMAIPYLALPVGFLLMLSVTAEQLLSYLPRQSVKGEK